MLKPLLAAVGGAAVGFWVAKMRYEKAAYAYANLRVEEAKVFAEARADREIQKFLAEAEQTFGDDIEKAKVDAVAKVFESENVSIEGLFEDNPVVDGLVRNYQGFSSPAPSTTEDEESESHIILIRRAEFFEGPLTDKYDQTSVTYYQNDDILVDPHDKQLDVKAAIGSIRPSWFGNEADDENVCYVRNTQLEIEFEVNRSQGSYARDVLGLNPDAEGGE
jgi:hypothetical protein